MEKQKILMTNTLTTPFVYYNKAEELSEKAQNYFLESITAMNHNNARGAIEQFNLALHESPDSAQILNNFGAYLSTVGNVRDGAKLLEQGIKS